MISNIKKPGQCQTEGEDAEMHSDANFVDSLLCSRAEICQEMQSRAADTKDQAIFHEDLTEKKTKSHEKSSWSKTF